MAHRFWQRVTQTRYENGVLVTVNFTDTVYGTDNHTAEELYGKGGTMMRKGSAYRQNALTRNCSFCLFYLGFIFFFLTPMIQSIRMSFSLVSVDSDTGYAMSSVGFSNYQTAFLEDSHFTTNLISSLTELLWRVPAILFLSIVFALLLNQKFKGRTLVRAIFFMPVLFASGIALQLISNDFIVAVCGRCRNQRADDNTEHRCGTS